MHPAGKPDFFDDLNLDYVIATITAGKEEYDLTPLFHAPLHDMETLIYRQGVMRDLEEEPTLRPVKSFASGMHEMRMHVSRARELHDLVQGDLWLLDGMAIYCDAVAALSESFSRAHVESRGLSAFRDSLADYVESAGFQIFRDEMTRLKADLSSVRYCVHLNGRSVTVRSCSAQRDFGEGVIETFHKFQQTSSKDYQVRIPDAAELNHVEAQILHRVARLNPELFQRLQEFCRKNVDFADPGIAAFDRDVQFYVAYLDYLAELKGAGLRFCYPTLSDGFIEIRSRDGFDIALAARLVAESRPVVCNDFCLTGSERVIVVSGPNQSGKTTFSRAFGQLHYLASLGLPVPGRQANLLLFDAMFTLFEREEDIGNPRGKLHDDLMRIRDILDRATARSIVIMNEIFASTTLKDAVFLGRRVMKDFLQRGCVCVLVTFLGELSTMSERVISMVGSVTPEDPAVRTFRIFPRPPEGLAYAVSIAEKHKLTEEHIKRRIPS